MLAVNVNGVIKEPKRVLYKKDNALIDIRNGFVKVDGNWKKFLIWTVENPINQTLLDVDLYKLLSSPKNPLYIEFINNGLIGAMSLTQSLLIKGFHADAQITIINNGDIIGKGGNGNDYPDAGSNGGDAIVINHNCNIINNGRIGGGGGGGASVRGQYQLATGTAKGGGGAGWIVGTGGGSAATMLAGGTGGVGAVYRSTVTGGAGGSLGKDGLTGVAGAFVSITNSAVGKAGKAINNTAGTTSTLTNHGTLYGVSDL